MLTADDFRRVFAYNEVLESFADVLRRLSSETSKNMDASHNSMNEVHEFMFRAMKGARDFMDQLDDSKLSKKITAPCMEGEHELYDVLMQVASEQVHHLGESIALLLRVNIELLATTWSDNI
jgi:uncharacterized damage-inducible protein DinB